MRQHYIGSLIKLLGVENNPPEFLTLHQDYVRRFNSSPPVDVLMMQRAERIPVLKQALQSGQKVPGDTGDVE